MKTGKIAPGNLNSNKQKDKIDEPTIADDPPLDEEEDDNDIGIIGKQPGDNKIIEQKTLVKQQTEVIANDEELNNSAEEIQFNMGGGQPAVDDQMLPEDDDFQ